MVYKTLNQSWILNAGLPGELNFNPKESFLNFNLKFSSVPVYPAKEILNQNGL